MYFRGSPTKLEMVIRQPFTVDVPTGNQLLGSESRYGTHQLVIYEWKAARDLNSLLSSDPVLNPKSFVPPQSQQNTALGNQGSVNQAANQMPSQPGQSMSPQRPPLPAAPTRLNPNDNVGLIREAKSWLHLTRDQRHNTLKQQAQAAGLLVNGQFRWELQPMDQSPVMELNNVRQPDGALDPLQPNWTPPPEFRHKRDHLPEVTRLQFRYFDGADWQLNWQSDKQLPLAIEVAFDLDPNAPAARAKEFEIAHSAMLGGATLQDVLPPEEELPEEASQDMDTLLGTNLLDPTAIITEYRFIVRVPAGKKSEREQATNDELQIEDSAAEGEEPR